MTRIFVGPLPRWMPVSALLGEADWSVEPVGDDAVQAVAKVDKERAADIDAALRGLAFGGLDLQVRTVPPLKRSAIRDGRTRDARLRRDTTPGFTRKGARLDDDEGHRSLTPEALALALGERVAPRHVLDLTCGAGGNSIGFARAGCTVTAVERDATRIALARHNARIYEVDDRIMFVHADALDVVRDPPAHDLAFVDPPWEGWDHRRTTLADLPLLHDLVPRLLGRPFMAKVPPSFVPQSMPVPVRVEPWFGRATGDRHRVKFLVVEAA